MSDFGTINVQYNTGTDSSPTWTGTAIAFGGGSGVNEIRFAPSSGATSSTASASWPFFTRPASTSIVPQLWAFTADTTGSQITTYDTTNTHYAQVRVQWDSNGTYASQPTLTSYADTSHTTVSSNTGGPVTVVLSGDPIVRGSSDTSGASYLKANAFGYGVTAAGATEAVPSSAPTNASSATSGAAGNTATSSAAWLTNWTSLQGGLQAIQNGVTPGKLSSGNGYWHFLLQLYTGPNMATASTILPVVTYSYSFS